jgi:uncharacterized protein (DUF58 family)
MRTLAVAPGESDAFPLVPRRRLRSFELGSARSMQRGLGSEVAGIRPYEPGDDVRRIDWAASARLSAASGADEFLVREHDADLSPRVVAVVDRRPGMLLYPSPWLAKGDVVRRATRLIVQSARHERALAGVLELRRGELAWSAPAARRRGREDEGNELVLPAAGDELTAALELLLTRRGVPAGTFVFLLSDFLVPPAQEALLAALGRPLDLVPVVVQDPTWEASFPTEVGGLVVPLTDPQTGVAADVRVSRAEARRRRRAHEERHHALVDTFAALGLDPVSLERSDPPSILAAFLAWSESRLLREWRAA